MFQFRKISCHLIKHKLSYILLLILIIIGFISGCFYTNFLSDGEFLDAGIQAEEFIKRAKEHELNLNLMLSEELSTYLLIALCSLFLPGFIPTVFLVFKWGFSSGFFLTFLIKYFAMKGFFLGGLFLLTNLLFFLFSLLLIANKSLSLNRYLLCAALHRAPSKQNLSEELITMTIITLIAVGMVTLGVFLKFLLLSPLSNYLFL